MGYTGGGNLGVRGPGVPPAPLPPLLPPLGARPRPAGSGEGRGLRRWVWSEQGAGSLVAPPFWGRGLLSYRGGVRGPFPPPPPVPQFPHFGSHLRVSSAGGALGGPPGAVGAAGRVRPTAGLRGRGPSNPPAAPAEPPRAAGNIPRHPHPPPIAVSDGALGTPTPKVPHVGPPVGSSWDWAPTVHPWYSSRAPPSTGTPMPP